MSVPSWAIPVKDQKPPSWAVPVDANKKTSVMEAVFPRTSKGGSVIAAPALDIASLPGRLLSSGPGRAIAGEIEPQQFLQNMADTKGRGLVQQIARDPAMATIPLAGPAVAGARALGLTGLKALGAAGLMEGAIGAGMHQSDRALSGEPMQPGMAAFETGLGGALPIAGPAANKTLGRLASGLSGVSEEALRMYGTGFSKGAAEIRQAAGKQNEIGQRLADAIDNAYDYMPEKAVVDNALKNMPEVNIAETIRVLQDQVDKLKRPTAGTGAFGFEQKAIKELEADIAALRGRNTKMPQTKYPAEGVRDLRRRLDVETKFGDEADNIVNRARMAARTQLKNDLIDAAKVSGNQEYVTAMESWANKLQKVDEIKGLMGGNSVTRKQRAESFTANLFGKNKTERQKLVKDLGEVFGEDFLEQSKLAKLAAEFGEDGTPGLLPMQTTGRAGLGFTGVGSGATGFALTQNLAYLAPVALGSMASPRVAATTLGAADATARFVKPVAPALRAATRSLGQRK